MPLFRDPLGHEFEITHRQAVGQESITCSECGWLGSIADGGAEVIEKPSETPGDGQEPSGDGEVESDTDA